jgi:NADH dehydrogenase/NADH oxidase (H2O2-forming)
MNENRVRHAVLVGAGAVGIETAYLVARKGVKITMVEMCEHVLPGVLDREMSAIVQEYVRTQGVALRLGEKVASLSGTDRVRGVTLSSGEGIDAGMVVLSVGVRARTELAEEAGLELGARGLKVNSRLQTSDPDIYAAGDLIEYPSHVTGKPVTGQIRPNAVIGGRVIAMNIAGRETDYPALVNGFATKFFDLCVAGTGITERAATDEGFKVVSSTKDADSMHSMMRERMPYTVKLVFRADEGRVIGGQIVSQSPLPVKSIDAITVAVRSGWTAAELATLRCAGQPELSPDPGKEPIALAAEEVNTKLIGRGL